MEDAAGVARGDAKGAALAAGERCVMTPAIVEEDMQAAPRVET